MIIFMAAIAEKLKLLPCHQRSDLSLLTIRLNVFLTAIKIGYMVM